MCITFSEIQTYLNIAFSSLVGVPVWNQHSVAYPSKSRLRFKTPPKAILQTQPHH